MLWLGTENDGLYYFYPDSMQAPRQLLPLPEFVTCLLQESEEVLWVGTTTHFYRLRLPQRQWDTIAPLRNKSVRSIYASGPQTMWITTYEDGIFLWKKGKVTQLPTDRNGFLKNAHCIMEDNRHYFWITTNNGLFQASKTDLLRFAAGQQKNVYYHHYTKEKGFNTNEFNGGGCEPCGLKFNNGSSFSFPSLNGLVWFDPEATIPTLPNNPIILDGVQIDGTDATISDTIMADKTSGRISLWLATAYMGNSSNLNMEYKIKGPGTDKDIWNPLVNNFISFNGPRSGMFVLTVRKAGGFGPDNYIFKQVYIHIPKAFWETWWFMLLLLLGATSLVFLLVKVRVHLLEQKNKEQENVVSLRTQELRSAITSLEHAQQDLNKEVQFQRRLNASITHDIKTPIQYLNLSLKYLFLRKQKERASDAGEIGEIFQATERIFHFTNSLTGYVKVRLGVEAPAPVVLRDITQRKIEMFAGAAGKAGNVFINNIPESLTPNTYAPLLDIILHNLIDNANKHTSGGLITIDATPGKDGLLLRVADTGKGMSDEQVTAFNHFFSRKTGSHERYPIGLGFLTIVDTLEWIKGNIILESKPGKGTAISLILPLL
jgi:signal transduction histidine kinase